MKRTISLFASLVLFLVCGIVFYTRQEYLLAVISSFFVGVILASMQIKKRERSKSFQKNGMEV